MALNQLGLGMVFTATDLASGVMHKVRNGFSQTRNEMGQFGARSKDAFRSFAVGAAMMTAGLTGMAILGTTVKHAEDFGKSIALVSTEVDEAAFSTADMRKITLQMAQTFGRMPTDEAGALYKAVALGANDATKATYIMTAANKLAVAGNSNLSVTMDALGGSLNAYKMDMSKASEVSDYFITAMKGGNTTVQDLASSVGRVSAGAHDMGIRIDEVLGSVGVMTNKGVQASEAVSYLHGALANIAHPSQEAAAEAARLGIKFDAAAVRSQGFVKFLHSIRDNAKFSKDTLNKLFTSVEGAQAMSMLANDLGSVDAMMHQMEASSGATDDAFKKMAKTLAFSKDKFEATKEVGKILIGEVLAPMAQRTAELASRVVQAFNRMPVPLREFLVKIAAAIPALIFLGGAVRSAMSAVTILGAAIRTFGITSFTGLLATLGPVVLAVGAVTIVFYAFKQAISQNLGGIGDRFAKFWEGLKLTFHAMVQLFTQGGFSGAVRKEFEKGENPFIAFAIKVYVVANRIKSFFKGVAAGFGDVIAKAGPTFEAFGEALAGLGRAFGLVTNNPKEAGKAFDQFGETGKALGHVLADIAEGAVKVATAIVQVVTFLQPAFSAVGNVISFLVVRLGRLTPAGKVVMAVLGGIALAAVAASSPFLAMAAAVAAVVAALDQLIKLKKELAAMDAQDKSRFKAKLRHDLGGGTDKDMADAYGIKTGADYDKDHPRRPVAPPASSPQTSAGTAPAAQQATDAAGFNQKLAALNAMVIEAAGKAKVLPPVITQATLVVDGATLGTIVSKAQASDGARGGGAVPVDVR